jgi:amino acid adenylation domain-containing protein
VSESLHGLLSAAAESAGQRTAVVDGQRQISYADLDSGSSRLAAAMAARGVRPGDRVGLVLEKSIEAVVAIYGTLKAGAVYVPLDDQAPVHRLAYIARDAGIRCLICSQSSAPRCREMIDAGVEAETVIGAPPGQDEDGRQTWLPWSSLEAIAPSPPSVEENPDSLAYILYTSGSTGEPKGVMLSHANGMAFVSWAAGEVGVTEEDRLSSHAPFHFDLSTFDLFAAAHGAATVVLVPRELSIFPVMLSRFIAEQGITVWYSVPSALTALVLRGELESTPLAALRVVIFAGEVFPVKYLSSLMELVPQARFLNFYGPTETNVCTWYEVSREVPLGDEVPIGRPLPGVEAAILLDDGSPAPEGESGELVIGGPTVMHGYWGDQERTARTLAVDGPVRRYRTGDLVRRRPDGELMFSGRRDSQVKTRGYRVELGEVEAALNAIDCVLEAAVIAVPDDAITNRLKAFVASAEPLTSAQLARMCRERLPGHMIPDEFELRAELPKSSTGKVDRRSLQQ